MSAMEKSKISRVVQLAVTLKPCRCYTPAKLAEISGVTRRTVFRDLKELRNAGIYYAYDRKKRKYLISPKSSTKPPDTNTPQDPNPDSDDPSDDLKNC